MTFIALVPPVYYNVKMYGATGDTKTVTDGAMTSGTATLTSSTANFASTDVGKMISVVGAGTSGANLKTTISAYVSTTQVTLAANASTTVSGASVTWGTDDTTAIANARSAANSAGGGTVFYPQGTYTSGNQTIYNNVIEMGAGKGSSIINLKNSANTDLFSASTSSINLSAANGTGITGGAVNFGFKDLTLDGNKANQTSGPCYPLRFYGRDFILENIDIQNGYSGGMLCDWNGGAGITGVSDQMEARWRNVKIHDCSGVGMQMGGPHDSHLESVFSYNNTSHGFHFAPNAAGCLLTKCHPYNLSTGASAVGILIEAMAIHLTNCMWEGSDTAQVVILANDCSVLGGEVFDPTNGTTYGIILGQNAGQTPLSGQILQSAGVTTAVTVTGVNINTHMVGCNGASLKCVNEVKNTIIANIYQSSGNAVYNNAIDTSDIYFIVVGGLTNDGTLGHSGGSQVNQLSNFSTNNMAVNANSNTNIAALIGTGADSHEGVVVYANSTLQTAFLLDIQNSAFSSVFNVDKAGNVQILGHVAIDDSPNTGAGLLIGVNADTSNGMVIYAHSATQSAPLLALQNNPAFANVFTVDASGNIVSLASLSVGQSASAPALATGGTITTANIGESRVAPTAAVTGIILQSGTVTGQQVTVVNESAFTVTFAAVATSHVADGTSAVIAANRCMFFQWDSGTSKWYHS